MKKIVAIVIAVLLLGSNFVACTNNEQPADTQAPAKTLEVVENQETDTTAEEQQGPSEAENIAYSVGFDLGYQQGYQEATSDATEEIALLSSQKASAVAEINVLEEQLAAAKADYEEARTALDLMTAAYEAAEEAGAKIDPSNPAGWIDWMPLHKEADGTFGCGFLWANWNCLQYSSEANGFAYKATHYGENVHIYSSYDEVEVRFAENVFGCPRASEWSAEIIVTLDGYYYVSSLYTPGVSGNMVLGGQADCKGYALQATERAGSLGWINTRLNQAFVLCVENNELVVRLLVGNEYVAPQYTAQPQQTQTITEYVYVDREVEKTVVEYVEVPGETQVVTEYIEVPGETVTEYVYIEVPGETQVITQYIYVQPEHNPTDEHIVDASRLDDNTPAHNPAFGSAASVDDTWLPSYNENQTTTTTISDSQSENVVDDTWNPSYSMSSTTTTTTTTSNAHNSTSSSSNNSGAAHNNSGNRFGGLD